MALEAVDNIISIPQENKEEPPSETQFNNQWVDDTGSSNHVTNILEGLEDLEDTQEEEIIKVGDGKTLRIEKFGKFNGCFLDENNNKIPLTIDRVGYVPEIVMHLFSVNKALSKGMKLTNIGRTIVFIMATDIETFSGKLFPLWFSIFSNIY